MLAQQQIQQKRRQKILARARLENNNESEEQTEQNQPAQKNGADVFQRYAQIKNRQRNEESLSKWSKCLGLPIVLIQEYIASHEIIFIAFLCIVFVLALMITKNYVSKTSKDEDILSKSLPFTDKLELIQKVFFVVRITINLIASYLLAAVILSFLSNLMGKSSNET